MENRKYVLAIKRNKNDYLPLEWHLTPFYHGEDLSTLEGIDNFTKNIRDVDLLVSITDLNMVNISEPFQKFAIIYQEKGRIRELKDGPIFLGTTILTEDELIYFILNNMHNKKLINRIYNVCAAIGSSNLNMEKFKLSLNNLDVLYNHNPQSPLIALGILKEIPYEERRTILVRVSTKVLPEHIKEVDPPMNHRKIPEIEDKIA